MPESVKIIGGVVICVTCFIVVRDHGHWHQQHTHEKCVEYRMKIQNDSYTQANRVCKKIFQ